MQFCRVRHHQDAQPRTLVRKRVCHWAGAPFAKVEAKRSGSGCEGRNMFPGTSTGIILALLVVKFAEESFLNPRTKICARAPNFALSGTVLSGLCVWCIKVTESVFRY